MRLARVPSILVLCATIDIASFGDVSAAWVENGIPIRSSVSLLGMEADDAGGALIVWNDGPNGFVQNVDALGNLLLGSTGRQLTGDPLTGPVVSDGEGGVLIPAVVGASVVVVRVGSTGDVLWFTTAGTSGRPVYNPYACPDGAGGAYVVWADQRDLGRPMDFFKVYGQRVNDAGVPMWTPNGVLIAWETQYLGHDPNPYGQDISPVAIVRSTLGHALVCSYTVGDLGQNDAILMSDVDSNGGVVAGNYVIGLAPPVVLCADGAGGAYLLEPDYLRHFDSSLQPRGALFLSLAGGAREPQDLIPESDGGAIAVWRDNRRGDWDLYAQRVDDVALGLWTPRNGVLVCGANGTQRDASATGDLAGGVVVTWADVRSGANDIYAQRITANGSTHWTANGVPVCTLPGDQNAPRIAAAPAGHAIVAWQSNGVFAQRIDLESGGWGAVEPQIAVALDVSNDEGGFVLLVWGASSRDREGNGVGNYTVWRRESPAVAGTESVEWEQVGDVAATGASGYLLNAPTTRDAVPGDPAVHEFFVRAHASGSSEYWDSNIISAASVDNIAPDAPTLLQAERVGGDVVQLTWQAAGASDVGDYAVYRASTGGGVVAPANFLANSNDVAFTDNDANAASVFYYAVTARDIHANESVSSNEAGVQALAVAITAFDAHVEDRGVVLTAAFRSDLGAQFVQVYRAEGDGPMSSYDRRAIGGRARWNMSIRGSNPARHTGIKLVSSMRTGSFSHPW